MCACPCRAVFLLPLWSLDSLHLASYICSERLSAPSVHGKVGRAALVPSYRGVQQAKGKGAAMGRSEHGGSTGQARMGHAYGEREVAIGLECWGECVSGW